MPFRIDFSGLSRYLEVGYTNGVEIFDQDHQLTEKMEKMVFILIFQKSRLLLI